MQRLVAAEARGRPTEGDRRDGQDHDPVLPRQARQREQQEAGHDQAKPQSPARPGPGRQHQADEARQRRGGEQHVFPDDAWIDQPVGDHRPEQQRDRRPPAGARLGQHQQRQGAVEQQGVEEHEQARAAHDRVEQAEKPGHHRRVPVVVDAAAALGELEHRVVGHVSRQVDRQRHRRAQTEQGQREPPGRAGPFRRSRSPGSCDAPAHALAGVMAQRRCPRRCEPPREGKGGRSENPRESGNAPGTSALNHSVGTRGAL